MTRFKVFQRYVGGAILALMLLAGFTPAVSQTQPTPAQAQFQAYGNLMTQAALAIQQQNWPVAVAAAKAAFSTANNDIQRLDAARLVASAHFRARQFSRAEWWLRLALNNASEGAAAQAVHQDFALVRQENPLSVQLNFSAAPNNNVNNGSSSESITIWNLPFILSPDALALSGYEVSGSVELRYRLAQSANFATDIGLLLHARTYELSAAAAHAAPGINGSDYAFSVVELLLSHSRNYQNMTGPTTFSANLGQNWYGGNPYTKYARVTVAQDFRISPTTGLNLTVGTEHQVSLLGSQSQSDIHSISTGLNHQLANRNRIGGSFRWQTTNSQDASAENDAVRIGVNYGLAKPVAGMMLSFNVAAEKRDYGFSIYDIAGRHDVTLSAGATALFSNISYLGFSPTVSLEANQTKSNVSLFNRETIALRFGLQSVF